MDMFEVMCGVKCRWLVVSLPNHPFFMPCFKKIFITLCSRLGLSHPLVLGVSHCIYSQPLDLMGIHLLCYTHGEEESILHDIFTRCFCGHYKRCEISYLATTNSCPSTPWYVVFVLSNWHCVINQWFLHVDKCYHYQFHSNWFGFADCFFSWDYYNSCNSSK